jgi:hypothetical protein
MDHSNAYLQCIWVSGVGLDDVDVLATDFGRNLGLDGGFVADETEDDVVWVGGELSEKLELQELLVMSLVHQVRENVRRDHERLLR